MALLQLCLFCESIKVELKKVVVGTFLKVEQRCKDCLRCQTWRSQPFIGNIPAGNLLLSSAILFSGSLPSKAIRLLQILGCCTITTRTFFSHQKRILHQAVASVWKRKQNSILEEVKQDSPSGLILAGDGRADSPGHCAKFGSYSLIDVERGVVVAMELVQVSLELAAFCKQSRLYACRVTRLEVVQK